MIAKYDSDEGRAKIVALIEDGTEPWFIIRAQDRFAPGLLRAMADHLDVEGGPEDYCIALDAHARVMRLWQERHPDRVKDPD